MTLTLIFTICTQSIDGEEQKEYIHLLMRSENILQKKNIYQEENIHEKENIHQKRKRGEKMRKKGAKGAPTDRAIRRSQG